MHEKEWRQQSAVFPLFVKKKTERVVKMKPLPAYRRLTSTAFPAALNHLFAEDSGAKYHQMSYRHVT